MGERCDAHLPSPDAFDARSRPGRRRQPLCDSRRFPARRHRDHRSSGSRQSAGAPGQAFAALWARCDQTTARGGALLAQKRRSDLDRGRRGPSARRIVELYKKRWTIEQLFRLMKKEGLQLEDSRLETADRLLKLAAIAAKAAAITLQLVLARDGQSAEPASLALNEQQIEDLAALAAKYKGRTTLQSNPHPAKTLAWAAWIIARLGGWDGYPRTKPGPITMRHGLQYFLGVAQAWSALKDV